MPGDIRGSIRAGAVGLAAVAVALCGVVVYRSHFLVDGANQFTLIDDAMISMRYARNLARGDGLVWNVGEPPIEGFTNLGYTLLMAPGFAFGDGLLSRYLPVLLTVSGFVATVLLTIAIAKTVCPNSRAVPLAAGAMVALDFGLIFWSSRGMEVPLVTAAVLGMTLMYMRWRESGNRRQLWLGAICGAVAITLRMDALAVVLAVAAWLIAIEKLAGRSIREALIAVVIPAAALVAVLAFQGLYFGDPLPNTYRLKVEGVSALDRILVGLRVLIRNAAPQLFVLLLLGPLLLARYSRQLLRNANVVVLGLIAAVSVGYSVWVGGDYAEPEVHAPNRFILVGIPGLCVLAAAGSAAAIRRLFPSHRAVAVRAATAVAVAAILAPNFYNLGQLVFGDIPLLRSDKSKTVFAIHARNILPRDTTIATHSAGQLPYYLDLRTIDLLGKSDRHIATMPQAAKRFRPGHSKWDYDYSIGKLKPDVIVGEFSQSRPYLESHGGYTRLPNSVWVSNSPRVPIDVTALSKLCWVNCDR
jgi:arabinofuranosyltransferase